MAQVRTKVEAFDIEAVFADDEQRTGQERSAALASFARSELAKAVSTNRAATGSEPRYETSVDGVPGASIDQVKPDGVIVFDFDLGTDLVRYVFDLIVQHSPVLTGAYRASHMIFADGVQVASPEAAAGAEEVVITTVVPYARKIEGAGGKRPLSTKAPEGVYEVVAAMAAKRFGNSARIKFTYREPMVAGSALQAWASRNAGRKQRRRQMQRNLRQPAISISFR